MEGVCHALTRDGSRLPVIDVTHPAFHIELSTAEQQRLISGFLATPVPFSWAPGPLRRAILRVLLRNSVLAEGIRGADGSFLTGMHTYLLKIGPDMLGSWATEMDRKIAASLPALNARLRLQDMATLLARVLAPMLGLVRDIWFLNIAGGSAIDALNALLLLNRQHGEALRAASLSILVLDRDDAGPAFGKAAQAELSQHGAPLHGTNIDFRHIRYDWGQPAQLEPVLKAARGSGATVVCSSEGGLFEYGSDAEIHANLTALRRSEVVTAVAGSVTRADAPSQRLAMFSTAALHRRGLDRFRTLAAQSGWTVAEAIERPFSDQVLLR